jgi:arginyl-tRNA synthetase
LKHSIQTLLSLAITSLQADAVLPADTEVRAEVERARDKQHGDFASTVALGLAKAARRKPRELAELIAGRLPHSDMIAKVEIAGPGFINFFLTPAAFQIVVGEIFDRGEAYGLGTLGQGKSVQIEFVSANPNGPLHVGHGRGAAIGSALANLLETAGYKVYREYYVNDAGRQMDILTVSI